MEAVADHNAWTVIEQVVITVGAVLIAVVPILVSLHRKADRTYRHVNSIEEQERVPDGEGSPTLGQLVRDGFRRNDDVHASLTDAVHSLGRSIDQHVSDPNAHTRLPGWSSPIPRHDRVPDEHAPREEQPGE